MEEINELDYLHWVIKESNRKVGGTSSAYIANEEISLDGGKLVIPSGVKVLMGIGNVGNDPNIWKNPEEFIPERFDSKSPYFLTPSG
jgi:cytochrome P450